MAHCIFSSVKPKKLRGLYNSKEEKHPEWKFGKEIREKKIYRNLINFPDWPIKRYQSIQSFRPQGHLVHMVIWCPIILVFVNNIGTRFRWFQRHFFTTKKRAHLTPSLGIYLLAKKKFFCLSLVIVDPEPHSLQVWAHSKNRKVTLWPVLPL